MSSRKETLVAGLSYRIDELRGTAKIWRGKEKESEDRLATLISTLGKLRDQLADAVEQPLDPLTASEISFITDAIDDAANHAKDEHLAAALRAQRSGLNLLTMRMGVGVDSQGRIVFTPEPGGNWDFKD